ncbi:MAG: hypothetical protein EOP45_12630 [Sphingobacteriaceae bacterium]|nr:MAG: hypothetical protein EOP45_12630 [Sphingobacteriaceae bacterium]
MLAEKSDFPSKKTTAYYNLACCLSLAGKPDSALTVLSQAVKSGYNNKSHLLIDSDLKSLHVLPGWQVLVSSIRESKKVLNSDPARAQFVTSDIHHFWDAYDKAMRDTARFKQIMKVGYFDPASQGMNDYMGLKVSSIDEFIRHIRSAPAFYRAIRENTLKVDQYKPAFLASYVKFSSLYKGAMFPNVYFVIGAFTSGGTVSNAGLLLGINQSCLDSHIPLGELSFRQRTRIGDFQTLPNVVAHELIHYQQDGMKRDTTTLSYVIFEGMADFMAELISGKAPGVALYAWAAGKEQQIWGKFKKDMYYNRYDNWIANSQQATPDNLPDQGYWIGYQICRSYYEQAADKKQAIYDMLHIQDYKVFLEKSKWEDKLASLLL